MPFREYVLSGRIINHKNYQKKSLLALGSSWLQTKLEVISDMSPSFLLTVLRRSDA